METLWRRRVLLRCDSGDQPLHASQLLVSSPLWDCDALCQAHNSVPVLTRTRTRVSNSAGSHM